MRSGNGSDFPRLSEGRIEPGSVFLSISETLGRIAQTDHETGAPHVQTAFVQMSCGYPAPRSPPCGAFLVRVTGVRLRIADGTDFSGLRPARWAVRYGFRAAAFPTRVN